MITTTETIDLLLVEDDEDDYFITRSLLGRAQVIDCNLNWVQSYDEGLAAIRSNAYDVALVDYQLGAHNGLELLREANAHGRSTPIILLTGQGDIEVDISAMEAGAADYLSKGAIDAPLLERSIRYAHERKAAEERIRKQAALLDKARDAIIAYDMDGRVVYWNKSAERLTGWSAEEMMGEHARERLYDDKQRKKLKQCRAALEEEGEWKGELQQQTREGDELIVESRWTLVRNSDGTPESILVINTDITERKQLEQQFLRSQRMESIGRLVSGIAHDLGNLLVPISLGVKVLEQRFGDDERASRTLSMIQNSAERGSDMVDQVLAFARGVEGERVALQPDDVIREVRKITTETFPDRIEVNVNMAEDLQPVVGDATQIQQVLMNLCVNARDAMPEGGTLRLEAKNVTLSEAEAGRNLDAEPGSYVVIIVADTGTGMPDEVLDKVFEPFYTTKSEGKGTGLGLSTAYSIIKSHDGFIDVDSEEGEGTTFRLFLPIASSDEEVGADAPSTRAARAPSDAQILVVDDDDTILDATRDTLESAGYRVFTARGGQEALRILDANGQALDAVITDIMMPDVDGLAVIQQMEAQRPEVPVIAASGVANGREDALNAGAEYFLVKPFTTEKLQDALHNVLATSPT